MGKLTLTNAFNNLAVQMLFARTLLVHITVNVLKNMCPGEHLITAVIEPLSRLAAVPILTARTTPSVSLGHVDAELVTNLPVLAVLVRIYIFSPLHQNMKPTKA